MFFENLNFFILPFLIVITLSSVMGFGLFIHKVIGVYESDIQFKNLFFFQGLIFVGLAFIFINFFFPISDTISFFTILLGLIIYIYYFFKLNNKKQELIFIFSVTLISLFYSVFAGLNDDFPYHYETIKNFKNKILFEIEHHRMISYNSHWLFLNSIFSISIFTSTLFILTSLLFSISIYDFYNIIIKFIGNKERYISTLSFFSLIFILGILHKYKDLGTDGPGAIINIYILIILSYHFFDKKNVTSNNIFIIILILCQFSFMIKITNTLIYLFLIFLIFKFKFKKINFLLFLFVCLIPVPWLFQNYIISNCLIWPISFTCFSNPDQAIQETYLIESFAKGDITTTMNLNGLSWIKIWLINHSSKLIETYFLYTLILFIPFILISFNKKYNKIGLIKFVKKNFFNKNYLIIFFIICISNLVWFVYAPAYRFGIFYNLSLIIIFFIPIWLFVNETNSNLLINYSKIILILVSIYFVFENIRKVDWYLKRYDIWPPIYEGKILDRKSF